MLLAIDVGNTHVVIGLFDGETLKSNWRLESDAHRTVDEFAIQLLAILRQTGVNPDGVNSVVISCVVPVLTRVFSKLSRKYFSSEAIIVGPGIKTGLEIQVDDPQSVGSDRIVNAVSAKELYGAPSIVVDFGTATTFDVVSAPGVYQGGVIAPGVLISAEAMFEKAALLPSIELSKPSAILGKNTKDSMLAGIYYGYLALVDGILQRLISEIGPVTAIVATGGLARSFAEESSHIQHLAPELTLHGLRIIASYNS